MNPALSAAAERQEFRARVRRIQPVLVHEPAGGIDDEVMAARSDATLLISARTRSEVEIVARRIHQTAASATPGPFVCCPAGALPAEPRMLEERCTALLAAAAGGSLLMTDVEEMSAAVQLLAIDVLADVQHRRGLSAAVRIMAGTTVSLIDRMHDGTFSARLFYRLNVIHLVY